MMLRVQLRAGGKPGQAAKAGRQYLWAGCSRRLRFLPFFIYSLTGPSGFIKDIQFQRKYLTKNLFK
jgi:hypothetical protein